jgi:Flp pilus assembly protein TadD
MRRGAPQWGYTSRWRGAEPVKNDFLDRAIADFNEAIRRTSQHADAFWARGMAHQSNGQQDEADVDFEKAERLRLGLD